MSARSFDTHLHLGPEDDAARLLDAARRVGVGHFLVAVGNLDESRRAQALAVTQPGVVAAAGVHPHEASACAGDLTPFRELLRMPGVVAVGEIGLDYHYDHSPRDVQRRVFRAFMHVAADEKLPAVIHCREAFADCLAIVRECLIPGQPFEVHSFTGTPEEARLWLDLGGYLGFNGMVTFKKADNIRAALAVVPLDRLLLETDSPYLAPVPHRGQRNEPAYLVEVVKAVAHLRGLSAEATATATTANGLRLFGARH